MELKNVPPVLKQFHEEDSIIICISSGPSLSQEQIDIVGKEKENNSKIKVISCNDNWQWKYKDNYITDYLYAADEAWWQVHLENIRKNNFDKPLMIPLRKDYAEKNGLLLIPGVHQKNLGKREKIHFNQHSGFQIINIAYFLGAKKIILIGYDMQVMDVNNIHWFGNHKGKGSIKLRNTPNKYTGWLQHYDHLENDLKEEGVDIVNCTIDTAIKKIRKGKLEEELL